MLLSFLIGILCLMRYLLYPTREILPVRQRWGLGRDLRDLARALLFLLLGNAV
jgi:hypothetical protein